MASAVEALLAARERTLDARSAHIKLLTELEWKAPRRPRRRRGGLIAPLRWLVKAAARRA